MNFCMNAKIFRILVLAEILLVIAVIVSDVATRGQLPEELRRFHEGAAEFGAEMGARQWVLVFGGLSLAALALASLIGLLFLWRPARLLYTLSYVLAFPVLLLAGPNVSTAITDTISELASFLGGVLWALIYFSPVKQYFETDVDAPVA